MRSLTTEEIAKLRAKAKELKSQIKEYSKKTFETILLEDLDNLKL
jgi:preprotein translocase subunit Sec63